MISTHGVHLHDIPTDYDRVLAAAIDRVLANQSPDGSFEVPGQVYDIGDNSLGVSSLVAFAWQRSDRKETRLVEPFRRSIDWFLANRVYRNDNPGYKRWLRRPGSGEAYAPYQVVDPASSAFGDWPTTAWALLQAGNVLKYGDGLLTGEQRDALFALGESYWTWLTTVSEFNIQDADNQAIGAVVGLLEVSNQLRRFGREADADRLRADALRVYLEVLRPHRETDRRLSYFGEHSSGFDQNYGSIGLSFLYAGYLVSGEQVFYDDGLEMARYLDLRLSARGFDYGGPRHFEKHAGFEAVLGLRAYSGVLRSDLGRFLGEERLSYFYNVGDHQDLPNGHFAYMTIWLMEDTSEWYRGEVAESTTPFKLRRGDTSVVFTAERVPYLLTAAGTEVIQCVRDGWRGIGFPARDGVRTEFLLDGSAIRVLAVGGETPFLVGLPYATGVPAEKVLGVEGLSGGKLSFGEDGGTLSDPLGVRAGPLVIESAGGIEVVNPPAASDRAFSSSATIDLDVQAFVHHLDWQNHNQGWARAERTNWLIAYPGEAGLVCVTYRPADQPVSDELERETAELRARLVQPSD